ncbi:MAG: hypothetical protein KatS3mg131_2560 [Candidatus Tectimicrobiota bacterium]|nr:MAG: hypothetical protein KatS3mg131_2560 [Candidatus Tectomicrobia bacterium]
MSIPHEPSAPADPVAQAWHYPLFEAILQRRARRFPLGATMPGKAQHFVSPHPPLPLSPQEEALLILAGTGLSGLQLGDLPFVDAQGASLGGNTLLQFAGRVYASACGAHGTELFYTNDTGVYLVRLRPVAPQRMQEYTGCEDRERLLRLVEAHTVRLQAQRLDIPRRWPALLAFNQWNVNVPGSTLFMPVTDVTGEYINLLLLLFDAPHRLYIYDDLNGNAEPLKRWAEAGKLERRFAYPLSQLERSAAQQFVAVEQALMLQNMYLALQAMGLGGWLFGAGNPLVVFGGTPAPGLGFRFWRPPAGSKNPAPHPVGLDGLFEAYCPPYYPSMAAAVEAVVASKWGQGGLFTGDGGPVPFRDPQHLAREVPVTPDEVVQMAKDLCTYIYQTYGRFPAQLDAMNMCLWLQAHHLETAYYDRFLQPGAYHEAIATHLQRWHAAPSPPREPPTPGVPCRKRLDKA